MARKLKVFRTVAGFHDAYVAAPSRKAALEAWGTTADLFARGAAEQVTDEALMAEPLKRPGEVIMKSRGGLADNLKALGPRKKKAKASADEPEAKPRKRSKPPSRDRLDKAEAALEEATKRHAAELKKLEADRDAIERRIEALRARQEKEANKLEQREREARETYRDALARWSD